MTGVVADASPLIALHQIGQLQLLPALFAGLLIPPAVVKEITPGVPTQPWMVERACTQPIAPMILRASLGTGESEAISLALEIRAERLILDEKGARRLAEAVGLNVMGTLGILLAAKRKGLIPSVRPQVEALLGKHFWISPRLVERALADIGEA